LFFKYSKTLVQFQLSLANCEYQKISQFQLAKN